MAFENLSDKLNNVFKKLRGKGRLSESDVKEAMREVRLALLEADVSYKVVKDFVKSVSERAVGADVLESLSPAQMVIKIVNEELCALMAVLPWRGPAQPVRVPAERPSRRRPPGGRIPTPLAPPPTALVPPTGRRRADACVGRGRATALVRFRQPPAGRLRLRASACRRARPGLRRPGAAGCLQCAVRWVRVVAQGRAAA